jgi:hypothetical protein
MTTDERPTAELVRQVGELVPRLVTRGTGAGEGRSEPKGQDGRHRRGVPEQIDGIKQDVAAVKESVRR